MVCYTLISLPITISPFVVLVSATCGAILGAFQVLRTVRMGIDSVQSWLQKELLEEYMKPLKDTLNRELAIQETHSVLLAEHSRRISDHDREIAMLQGKVFGGIPTIDTEEKR